MSIGDLLVELSVEEGDTKEDTGEDTGEEESMNLLEATVALAIVVG